MTITLQAPARLAVGRALAALLLAGGVCGCSGSDPSAAGGGNSAAAAPAPPPAAAVAEAAPPASALAVPGAHPAQVAVDDLAGGFAVWESNRSGDWRIWTARLDGSDPRRLSGEEPGRQHCCPHISPDGRWVVYLSRVLAADRYPELEVAGELRLAGADGAGERTLTSSARTYGWGNRIAVWREGGELIYVGGDGRTWLADLGGGPPRPLTEEPRPELGWLVDATLRYATNAAPSFSLYDAASRQVAERQTLGGCEPYFSHDGRWGFWVAGGGGPLERIELASRRTSTLIARDDPRLPDGRRYLYFPMLSRDGRVLAWGASGGEHDHFAADYDIFVAPTDPYTLELRGPPVRLTADPATDRYPDVWVPPLPLGYHAGEAPLIVAFAAPGPAVVSDWDYGDGARERTAAGRHTYRLPGDYRVVVRRGGETYRGRVVVEAPAPPAVVDAVLAPDGRRIEVRFDRPVAAGEVRLALESGLPVAGWRRADDGREIALELDDPGGGGDRLYLAGIRGEGAASAQMSPTWVDVEPPPWPSDRRRLLFLWQTADEPNLVFDPGLSLDRAFPLTPRGRARVNRRASLVADRGSFSAPDAAAANLLAAVRASGELTVEATIMARAPAAGPAAVVSFSADGAGEASGENLSLEQVGSDLVLRLRTAAGGSPAALPLFTLAPGQPTHVVITYRQGRMVAYRDGRPALASDALRGDLGGWRSGQLVFGDRVGGGADWAGVLEGIALYARALDADEVAENQERYRLFRARRAAAPAPLRLQVTLEAKSTIPTLRQISPYRQALVVYLYRVEAVLEGVDPGPRVRVAHWAILDGETMPVARARADDEVRLDLEPFSANPQLESHYLSDTLEAGAGLPLFYDLGV